MMLILPFIAAVLWNFQGSYYEGKWLGFGISFAVCFGYAASLRIGKIAAITLVYLLCNAMWVLFYAESRYSQVTSGDLVAIKYYTAEAAFKFLLIISPFLFLDISLEKIRKYGRALVTLFVVMSAGKAVWDLGVYGCGETNSCGGLLMNPSLNAGMLVAGLPIAVDTAGLWLIVPVAAAIIAGKSGVGLAMLALFVALYAVKYWWSLALIPAAIIARQFYGTEKILLSMGDRDVMWRFFMEKWAHNKANWLFGTGFGTFDFFSFNLQQHFSMRIQYWWKWMHNDLLEFTFETGLLGAALLVAVFIAALIGLHRKRFIVERNALFLFGSGSLVNYPLHIGLTCAFAAWLAFLGLSKWPATT